MAEDHALASKGFHHGMVCEKMLHLHTRAHDYSSIIGKGKMQPWETRFGSKHRASPQQPAKAVPTAADLGERRTARSFLAIGPVATTSTRANNVSLPFTRTDTPLIYTPHGSTT
jgi:hypothetical protein